MRAIGYWRPALGALAFLGFALNVSAADRPITSKTDASAPDNYGGQVLTPGPEDPLLSPANGCEDPHWAGILPAAGGVLSGDTYLAGDDFYGNLYPDDCGYSYGPSGNDEIWSFTVETDGRWTFDTCTIPAGWDTSLGVGWWEWCPGVGVACNGDDPCGSTWESAIRDVCLHAGWEYWLIVDGWSPASWFPGTYYDVTYARTADPCTSDADCADGIFCNGIEVCERGCCYPGPPACPCWATCYEATQECVNEQDPCTAVLNGINSRYIGAQDCETPGPGCEMFWKCDDIETWEGSGNKLISYKTLFQAREYWDDCNIEGAEFDVETAIFTNTENGYCLPLAEIPGTRCQFTGVVTAAGEPPQVALCEPGSGMQSGIVLPNRSGDTHNCEIDFFVCMRSELVSGFQIADYGGCLDDEPRTDIAGEFVGGPAASDDFHRDVVFYEGNDYSDGTCRNGIFSATWFDGWAPADFAELHVCVEPVGVCCFDAGGCEVVAEKDCVDGAYRGDNVLDDINDCDPITGDPDSDGFFFECDNCPDDFNADQADCNDDGQGDACDPDPGESDIDGDGCCDNVDACPNDPQKCADEGQCGCNETDFDTDEDGCMDCVDQCPNDPDKCYPGICGCFATADDRGDNDGDGFMNCVDQCPGADDAVYAPGCMGAIPTVSEWGLVILALLLLAVGKICFAGRRYVVR